VVATVLISSSISLPKAMRDLHEGQRLVGRVGDARVAKLAAENDPLAIWPNGVSHLELLQPGWVNSHKLGTGLGLLQPGWSNSPTRLK
jgi:hypothetical protein